MKDLVSLLTNQEGQWPSPTFAKRRAFHISGRAHWRKDLWRVFTFPLRQGDIQLGALDLYRDSAGPLDHEAMAVAQTLADVAAAYLINAQARADLRDSSDRFQQSSLHDPLTGLPNRVLLWERLDHAILRSQRSHLPVAILLPTSTTSRRSTIFTVIGWAMSSS